MTAQSANKKRALFKKLFKHNLGTNQIKLFIMNLFGTFNLHFDPSDTLFALFYPKENFLIINRQTGSLDSIITTGKLWTHSVHS